MVNLVLSLIGKQLSTEDQIFISSNLLSIPAFLGSELGKSSLGFVVSEFRKYLSK